MFALTAIVVNWNKDSNPQLPIQGAWGHFSPVIGVMIGIAWQLLDRRDLASRLFFPAIALALFLIIDAFTQSMLMSPVGTLVGVGIVAGLIMAELWLRRGDKSPAREYISQTDPKESSGKL